MNQTIGLVFFSLLVFVICQGEGVEKDATVEIVFPERIHLQRKKIDLRTELKDGQHEETFNVRIPTKQEGDLLLELKKRDVAPGRLLLRTFDDNGKAVHRWHDQPNCFYHGTVKNKRESNVHISTCDAINGFVEFDSKKYVLYPSQNDENGAHEFYPSVEADIQHNDFLVRKDGKPVDKLVKSKALKDEVKLSKTVNTKKHNDDRAVYDLLSKTKHVSDELNEIISELKDFQTSEQKDEPREQERFRRSSNGKEILSEEGDIVEEYGREKNEKRTAADYLYTDKSLVYATEGRCTSISREACNALPLPHFTPSGVTSMQNVGPSRQNRFVPGCSLLDLDASPRKQYSVWNPNLQSPVSCSRMQKCRCIKYSIKEMTASSVDGDHLPQNAIKSTLPGFFRSQEESQPWLKVEFVDRSPLVDGKMTMLQVVMPDCCGEQFKNVLIRAGTAADIAGNEVVGIFRGPGRNSATHTILFTKTLVFYGGIPAGHRYFNEPAKYLINPKFLIFQLKGAGVLAIKGFMDDYSKCCLISDVRCQGQESGECCSAASPCGVSQGQCSDDSQCEQGLTCGHNNCHWGQERCCQVPNAMGAQYLSRGGVLLKGTELTSTNGLYHCKMQYNGFLTVTGPGGEIWRSKRNDRKTTEIRTGLVFRASDGRATISALQQVWSTSDINIKSELDLIRLDDDGNLVMLRKAGDKYVEVWSSKHGQPTFESLKLKSQLSAALYGPHLHILQPASIPASYKRYMSTNQKVNTKYVEIFVSIGHELFAKKFAGKAHAEMLAVIEAVNQIAVVDQVFSKLNIRVVVTAIEVMNKGPAFQRHYNNGEKELQTFADYVKKVKTETEHYRNLNFDASAFLSMRGWPPLPGTNSGFNGLAHVGTMCHEAASINQLGSRYIIAHELGHNLGMDHIDDSCRCIGKSSIRTCLMNAKPLGRDFSDCSLRRLKQVLRGSRYSCLNNIPYNVAPRCGNGIKEGNEVCGASLCCNPATCQTLIEKC